MSLSDFLNPPEDILQALNDLDIYFQTIRQQDVNVYLEKGKDELYSGTIGEFVRLRNMKEYFGLNRGKTWDQLTKVIFLLDGFSAELDMTAIAEMSPEKAIELMEILRKGIKANKKLVEWIEPLKQGEVLAAIYGATKVKIGEEYGGFEVLEVGDFETDSSEGVRLFPQLLRITNPDDIIRYFKMIREKPKDSLIVSFQLHEDPDKDFKSPFYMFLLYKNKMYSISNIERRLNLDNREGMRGPGRYVGGHYEDVWLPVGWMLKGDPNKQELMIPDAQMFVVESFEKIGEEKPEILYWLAMFILRIQEYIEDTKDIVLGTTTTEGQHLLEDFNTRDDREFTEHKSQASASDYLVGIYSSNIKDIVLMESQLPAIIAPRERLINTIRYERRKELSKRVQDEVYDDYRANFSKTMRWIKKFVLSHDYEKVLSKALEDDVYPRMFYHRFSSNRVRAEESWCVINKDVHFVGYEDDIRRGAVQVKLPTILYEKILWGGEERYTYGANYINEFNWTPTGKYFHDDYRQRGFRFRNDEKNKVNCPICDRWVWKSIIRLEFKDYRQFSTFFNIPSHKLPKDMVKHLHQQNETYVGNDILQDTDPMDEVVDPWFREYNSVKEAKLYRSQHPVHLSIYMPMCGRCKRKIQKRLGILESIPKKKRTFKITPLKKVLSRKNGWGFTEKYQFGDEKRHYFVNGESLCRKVWKKHNKSPNMGDDHWDNCERCKKILKRVRRDGEWKRVVKEEEEGK